MYKKIIIYTILFTSIMLYGCGSRVDEINTDKIMGSTSQDLDENLTENENSEEIIFNYPVIEEKTREILNKPDGVITKSDVQSITEFELTDSNECQMAFLDLQWFINLQNVQLHGCYIKSLEGIDKLTKLETLNISSSHVQNSAQLNGLTSLKKLYASYCDFHDITAIASLINLEELYLGYNRIDDITAISSLTKLKELYLFNNLIEDISPIANLDKLDSLSLDNNKISDITPLFGLRELTYIRLQGNEIPEKMLVDFYEQNRKPITVIQKASLCGNMPEFTFKLSAYSDLETGRYDLQTVEVYEGDNLIQNIFIPDYALFGRTYIYDSLADTLGFELEDVNFDGYQDLRLYDTENGNYKQEWIYLVWDDAKYQFEHDARLNEISLAEFDPENKLIYGMERGGANLHYYSTYQYIDGDIVKICYYEEKGLNHIDNDKIKKYYETQSVKTDATQFDIYYIRVSNLNEKNGKLEPDIEEYLITPLDSSSEDKSNEQLHIDISSEIGKEIKANMW